MVSVVTGASGHVGANLVRALLDAGQHVRVLVRSDSAAIEGLDVERARGDVRDADSLRAAFRGADTVFHLAAIISISGDHDGAVAATNIAGVRNVAEAALASGVRRVVHCSSIHAFRVAGAGRIDEHSDRSDAPGHAAYDASKAQGERELRAVIARGLDAVVVNPTGVMGPYDFKPSRMGRVLIDLHRRALPALIDGGFNWVDVRDVAAGAIAAAERGRTGENYILGGAWASVRDVASIAAALTGVSAPRITAPVALTRLGVPFAMAYGRLRNKEPLYTYESLAALVATRTISSARAHSELGYTARPLTATIRDAYQWLDSAGYLARARTGARA